MKSRKVSQLSWVILFSLFIGVSQLQAADDIDVKQAQSMNKLGTLLLDVREPDEYAQVHAPNTTSLPLSQLSSRIQTILMYKQKPIAVMCHSGKRSAVAVKLLKDAGFSQVSNVSGGILAWQNAGLEVVRNK